MNNALIQQSFESKLNLYFDGDEDSIWLKSRIKDPQFSRQLELTWGCSDFAADQAISNPCGFRQLVESGDLHRSYSSDSLLQSLDKQVHRIKAVNDESELSRQLRLFRRREMQRIIWRDLNRLADLTETTRDVTLLAEACIQVALDYLHPIVVTDFGRPIDSNGNEQRLLVIAMGKMGGGELNLSSDIDLIFAYPEAGETEGAKRSVSNQQFFERLGQKLITSLDAQTVDGFVFRVDMRLRPYGQSGPLVQNFAALEDYYTTQGRGWERFAMIKARAVTGGKESIEKLEEILNPFVYRRYLDYGAIEQLRDLKRKINLEVARKGMQSNIKLGRGGIRELEFIVQSFQLIRGGRLQSLQVQSFKQALEQITAEGLLEQEINSQLWQAYQYLRNTEHVLQAIDDKQTQQLPMDELAQQRVALVMGQSSWDKFLIELDSHRHNVHRCFADMIADEETQSSEQQSSGLYWQPEMNADESISVLASLNYQQPEVMIETLKQFYASRAVVALAAVPRARLDALMPEVLRVCAAQEHSDRTFGLVFNLVQAVLRRSVYLTLLIENSQALEQLALLCQRSQWIADQLTAFPDLLDELLDPRNLYANQTKIDLQDQLRQQTLRLEVNDQEQQMEVIRYFVRACNLRIAASEITGRLSLMEASDQLTWTAEVVVEHVANVAWHQMAAKYGTPAPPMDKADSSATPGFIVVAYGKVGGLEMGYKSDLDLVFLHDDLASETSGGLKSVDSSTFFARLGQRIIHLLSTSTHAGMAYEIDMRLRPSGNSGMLVSSLSSFEKYQQQSAWTWEHQALVRSRVIAGDKITAQGFKAIRIDQLCKKRNIEKLRDDVAEMRIKMRKHLDKSTKDGKYCLKQASGGIVDIEFMVQFAVLAWSHKFEQLVQWTDTVRLLETMSNAEVISELQAQQLIEAYKIYRSAAHDLQLQNRPAEVLLSEFTKQREAVQLCWQSFLSNHKKED
ncbi:MAG: bifunctional [glutamate--ammonia ligase]-adenylyl-L-tyrosine phosphorylase/[glutamate--ammonia-ligase] adenylyltransferase [Porticoccaceae bacterium]|nr:bifunctional [glutamate--ammonia ligase]-adenylyl-L-tyrosine phosphorylase/[glutamate--ammonia-ligase] adenylyltransferase [Porticoccaceae bacterium]